MKKQNIKQLALAFCAGTLFLTSCSSDDDNTVYPVVQQFSGSEQSVKDYVTPELLATMQDLGLEVNLGNTPPAISGQFLDAPNILMATNIDNDTVGSTYANTNFTIGNYNPLANTIDISYTVPGDAEVSKGIGAVVSGHDNYFTIFAKQKVTHDTGTADSVMAVSGHLTEEGIVDFQFALFMLDNHGLATFIANGKGRLFHDQDNVAEKQ